MTSSHVASIDTHAVFPSAASSATTDDDTDDDCDDYYYKVLIDNVVDSQCRCATRRTASGRLSSQ